MSQTLFALLATVIISKVERRPPDFLIGDPTEPYLRRWWLIPRNNLFNVYLHNMLRDDEDRALHDHPYWNASIVLRGGFYEMTADTMKWRRPGQVVFRRATAAHRLALSPRGPSWSLFITGPRVREWGFHCPNGWVPWREFVDDGNTGAVGRGCGEHEVAR